MSHCLLHAGKLIYVVDVFVFVGSFEELFNNFPAIFCGCTLYTLLLLPAFNGWSRMSVSLLRLLGFLTIGTGQSTVLGHRHSLSTASSVTMVLVVCVL